MPTTDLSTSTNGIGHKAKPKFTGTKTEFVANLPDSLNRNEVVARGKAVGLKLNGSQVNKIRWMLRNRPSKKAGQQPQQTKEHQGTKAEFIASLPTTMSAREVVALGAATGLKLNVHQVHSLRWQIRTSAQNKPRGNSPLPPNAEPGPRDANELEFLKRAMEIGFGRAARLLALHRERCNPVMQGA